MCYPTKFSPSENRHKVISAALPRMEDPNMITGAECDACVLWVLCTRFFSALTNCIPTSETRLEHWVLRAVAEDWGVGDE